MEIKFTPAEVLALREVEDAGSRVRSQMRTLRVVLDRMDDQFAQGHNVHVQATINLNADVDLLNLAVKMASNLLSMRGPEHKDQALDTLAKVQNGTLSAFDLPRE